MSEASVPIAVAEKAVEAHSTALRRELGIGDLVLAQIMIVIVPEFFGTAVKAGAEHVVFWLLAIVLFFVPQALVVSHLNQRMPLEGGLYEWARLAFGDRMGFLVAWNMWLNTTVQVSQIALVTTTYLSYAFGPKVEWIASSPRTLVATSVVLIAGMMFVARLGLRAGKWLSNAGGILTLSTIGVLIVLPFFHVARGKMSSYHPLTLVWPSLTFMSISIFSKMTFGAFTGFEYVAVFAGESRNPARNLKRSILFTAPIIALLYILGTSAIRAFVSADAIDVIGPIPQALSRGFNIFGLAAAVVPVVILLLLINYICCYTLYFTANTRLPMVAGWDHLLPAWFSVLHAKYRTPVNSILFMAGVALAASLAVLVGAGNQEAFTLLQIWSFGFYGLAYLAMFAIPLFSPKAKGIRPGVWLQAASASALAVTLLFILFSVLPVVQVASRWEYSVKVAAALLGANVFGWLLYRIGQNKSKSDLQETPITRSS